LPQKSAETFFVHLLGAQTSFRQAKARPLARYANAWAKLTQ